MFYKFEQEEGLIEFRYKFSTSDDENEIILTTVGKMVTGGFQPDFVLSAKIALDENLIKHIKMKLC